MAATPARFRLASTMRREEINFQRLLRRCEALGSQGLDGDGAEAEAARARFETYLNALRAALPTLLHARSADASPDPDRLPVVASSEGERVTGDGSHSATAGNVDAAAVRPAEQLAEYARKIRFFESLLMDRSFTLATSPVSTVKATQVLENPLLSRGEQTKELEAGVHAQRRAERDLRGELFAKADGVRNRKTSPADRARAAAEEKRKQQVAAEANRMGRTTEDQDEIIAGMLGMARELRANTVRAGRMIEADLEVIDDIAAQQDDGIVRTSRLITRLNTYISNATRCSLMTWLMILVVCLLFVSVFLVIKVFPKPA